MYVGLEQAMELLRRRQAVALRLRVEEWWQRNGWLIPPHFGDMVKYPAAIFARQIATYRYEDAVFQEMARQAGFQPFWSEYQHDTMCMGNEFKRALCRPCVLLGVGKNGGFRTHGFHDLVEVNRWDGKPMCEIMTVAGSPLADLHHCLHARLADGPRADYSSWLTQFGETSHRYYLGYLSLFVAHAVLIENYDVYAGDSHMEKFVKRVVRPAFQNLRNKFDAQPLIVRLPWRHEFAYYPADAMSIFRSAS